ncbi:uncharacterized protein LOC113472414 [Diaphorina citri]|uniref:Uncharacterized protein LOC113472414 n=1 Tax=Diaphorina citri TaxID=121845 RepID=A0A3Q0JLF1_DIACI|nr:uncharacterized protein LOC113472414 [Diaphorina citri]
MMKNCVSVVTLVILSVIVATQAKPLDAHDADIDIGHANSTTKISNLNTSSTTLYWDTTADIPTTLTDWRITYFRNNNRSYIDNDYLTPLSYDSEAEYIKERDKMQMMSDAEPTQYETLYW